jgi:hypothetical protein
MVNAIKQLIAKPTLIPTTRSHSLKILGTILSTIILPIKFLHTVLLFTIDFTSI